MVPASHSEFYDFFEFGKLMDAKTLWFNFRTWDYTSIDNVNPQIFPTGVPGFKNFSNTAAKLGFSLSTHRMSGGLDPRDPDYCSPKPDQGLMAFGDMTLVNSVAASDTTITVRPGRGVKIPITQKDWNSNMSLDVYQINSWVCCKLGSGSIADEWITYNPKSIVPVAGGNWQIEVTRTNGSNHAAGAMVKGYLKGNLYYIPELFSELYEEVAVRYANFSNLIGFDDGSFDGAAWFGNYGRWGFQKFADLVYRNLDHPTSVHTSGLIVTPAWFEYRFNAVQTAYGGPFNTQPAGAEFDFGYVGRTTASVEEQSVSFLDGLITNSRRFTIGHDLRSVLGTYREIGNVKDVLMMANNYKAGSLAMGHDQRQRMADAVGHTKKVLLRGDAGDSGVTSQQAGGNRDVLNATWMVEGSIFRKWVTAETATYGSHYFSSNGYTAPRFYTKSGNRSTLVGPAELFSGFAQAKVSGRVLPRYDAASSQNIDLFAAMKLAPGVQLELTASNAQPTEVWDESNLKVHPLTTPLNLSAHQGIGMFVDGDGSGGTLVVRVICSTIARDFAVPLDFTGKQWIEIPTPEQGWRAKNWGPIGMGSVTWFPINYASVTAVALGVGYLPPSGHSKVTVSGLQAMSNIDESLVNPTIVVGDTKVQTSGTLRAFDMFTLDHNGTFVIYDDFWNQISNCSVGPFNPSSLTTFEMASSVPGSNAMWLEIGVAGATDTVPNPAYL